VKPDDRVYANPSYAKPGRYAHRIEAIKKSTDDADLAVFKCGASIFTFILDTAPKDMPRCPECFPPWYVVAWRKVRAWFRV